MYENKYRFFGWALPKLRIGSRQQQTAATPPAQGRFKQYFANVHGALRHFPIGPSQSTHALGSLLALAILNGCATFDEKSGQEVVAELMVERTPQVAAGLGTMPIDSSPPSSPLHLRTLSPYDAIIFALTNNPRLRVAYAQLGIADADLYDARRLPNPRLSLSVQDSTRGITQIGAGLVQNIAALITLSARSEIAELEAARLHHEIAAKLFSFSQDVRAAYAEYASAQQLLRLRQLTTRSIALSAELAARYYAAGNINKLELGLAEAAASEAALANSVAAIEVTRRRIRLGGMLGLPSNRQWQINSAIALPLDQEDDLVTLQDLAASQRLELKAAQLAVVAGENARALAQRYRYLGNFNAGIQFDRESDRNRLLGPSISIDLPIFNQGQGRVKRAAAEHDRRAAAVAELSIAVNNEVALAHAQVLAASERVAVYRERFIPARQNIVARTQELQNYMVVSPFELLRAKQAEYTAYSSYIEAIRDYTLARIRLSRALGADLPSDRTERDLLEIEQLASPATPQSHHQHMPSTEVSK